MPRHALSIDLLRLTSDRRPPTEVRLFSAGVNHSDKGDFLFDQEAATQVMAAYSAKGVDLSIDYDHQATATPEVTAPAAGWFALEVREGALWACNIRWTPRAQAHLEAAEYRYFSPLFVFDDRTGRITQLINLALTNTPALHGIDALVAASATTSTEEPNMDEELKKALARNAELERQAAAQGKEIETLRGQTATAALSSTLGLSATAGLEDIRTRVAALTSFHRSILELAGKDSDAAAIGALTAMKEQAAEVTVLRGKVEASELAALSAEFNAYLDNLSKAGADGKFLPPAKRKKAEAMALSLGGGKLTIEGVAGAKEYIAEMLVPGEAANTTTSPANQIGLSAVEEEILRQTNSSRDDLIKYKQRRLAGG